jgi:hypothetical protein
LPGSIAAWAQYKVGFREESFRTLMKNVAKDTFGHFMGDADDR